MVVSKNEMFEKLTGESLMLDKMISEVGLKEEINGN